jgi:hypothetical protein
MHLTPKFFEIPLVSAHNMAIEVDGKALTESVTPAQSSTVDGMVKILI